MLTDEAGGERAAYPRDPSLPLALALYLDLSLSLSFAFSRSLSRPRSLSLEAAAYYCRGLSGGGFL